MFNFFKKFLDANEREIKRLLPVVAEIEKLESSVKKLKEEEFAKQTERFKNRLANGESLDSLMPEAFALVREAAVRVINQRPFDEQVMAAIVLHRGDIAEQKTGEGKTLTAAMPLYLNGLLGKGVHLVTVNDYLARIGAGWMGPIFHLLGLSCAAIIQEKSFIYDPAYEDGSSGDWRLKHLRPISRKEAYAADITYGINSEFGFDYLRDNMARNWADLVQRGFYYAIIDEVDSVLIDEARTPHIISVPDSEPTEKYYQYAKIVEKLTPKLDFVVDEKMHTAHLTDHGIGKIEQLLGSKDLYEKDFSTIHHIEAALKAKTLYQRERDYIVKDGEIIIVDEFTGRLMPGRRWSEGIHQAIEAKEGVPIQQESKTLATISLQNYFRKYQKIAGMTGTAATEAEEFQKIYKLDVVVIPTHRKMIRQDFPDQVYKTQRAKYAAIVKEIEEKYRQGRPVLVGTTSIEKNEIISQFLRRKGIPHQVLNAKHHEKEAQIISQAGVKGAVTVATNMAGRGVDIILGGINGTPKDHDEVVKLGGLHVIGTERHESRRIDNQLRGRAGRQGDPGSSRFFLALDDDIMRLFGGEQVSKLMSFFNIPEDQPLEHPMVSRAIEQAQSKVEQFNFDARKHLLDYDDVMNKQREVVYGLRRRVLSPEFLLQSKEEVLQKVEKEIGLLSQIADIEKVVEDFCAIIPLNEPSRQQLVKKITGLNNDQIVTELVTLARQLYDQRERQIGSELARYIEQQEILRVIDVLWIEHLEAINDLREGINLRGYGQRDPLVEYKTEAFRMFDSLMKAIDSEIAHRIYKIVPVNVEQAQQWLRTMANSNQITEKNGYAVNGVDAISGISKEDVVAANLSKTVGETTRKIGRNDPCWCGSGKKYKKCHYPN